MGVTATDIIKIAQSWVGKKGSDGSHKIIIDTYNTQKPLPRSYKVKYTDNWCATFVSALFVKANALSLIYPECSCQKMIEGMTKKGIYIENENRVPKVGDIVFYDWDDNGVGDNKGWSDHVGIVESVTGNSFVVIEGNKNNAVGRRTCVVNQKGLRGFATPKYSTATVTQTVPTTSNITDNKTELTKIITSMEELIVRLKKLV